MNYEANGKFYKFVLTDGECSDCDHCAFKSDIDTCNNAPCTGGYFAEDGTLPITVAELQAVCRRALLNIYGDTWREDMSKLLDKLDGEAK